MPLSAQTIQDLRKQLDTVVVQGAAEQKAMAAAAAAPPAADFCSFYKTAKPLLQAALTFIQFIPGIGATIGTAIRLIITIGDQLCPG
jgi:hypothetical protein